MHVFSVTQLSLVPYAEAAQADDDAVSTESSSIQDTVIILTSCISHLSVTDKLITETRETSTILRWLGELCRRCGREPR